MNKVYSCTVEVTVLSRTKKDSNLTLSSDLAGVSVFEDLGPADSTVELLGLSK